MSWLKNIGKIAVKVLEVGAGIGPLVTTGAPQAAQVFDILNKIHDRVVEVEALGVAWGLSGAQKLEAVLLTATNLFLNSTMMVGKVIEKPELFKSGVKKVVEGVVDILNASKADG